MKTKFKVTQNGEILSPKKYTWNEESKTFSTTENNLVLDFRVVNNITFKTGSNCTFKTGFNCTFKTGSDCTFDTLSNCNFKTGSDCTFKTGSDCTFETEENCVIVRRDVFEIIEPPKGKTIKLNKYGIKGYTTLSSTKTIIIEGKEIQISEESFKALKESLNN